MRAVIYLSGRTGRSMQWHRECDTVASSVTIKKADEQSFLDALVDFGVLEEPITEWKAPVPHIAAGALEDLLSDNEDGPLSAYVDGLQALIECEASCGFIHLVKGAP